MPAHRVSGESLDALETVQAFGREKTADTRFSETVETAFKAAVRRIRARAAMLDPANQIQVDKG